MSDQNHARHYAHATTSCDLLIEAPWVTKLKAELKRVAKSYDAPFDKALRQEVAHYFEAIEKSLSDMRAYCDRNSAADARVGGRGRKAKTSDPLQSAENHRS